VNGTSTRRVKVESGGTGVVAHVGLHALGSFADRIGLGASLSRAVPPKGERRPAHDRGTVLVHTALTLAGGGEACTDVEHLAASGDLFGPVASDSTVYRTLRSLDAAALDRLVGEIARVRRSVWSRLGSSSRVVLDIDATLVDVHSENKVGAAPNYKGGYGFHPMFCFADGTGEALAGMLRPGNAGANTAADHIALLEAALDQLPDEVRAGHRPKDIVPAKREILVRTDSAGSSRAFVAALEERDIRFMTVASRSSEVHDAIFDAEGIDEVWLPAVEADGSLRPGAHVAELTSLVDLGSWPPGTRFVVRRERLHPGAQRSLFASLEHRYFGFYTDADGDPEELDLAMRGHAHVENHIERLKQSGLCRFPFTDWAANSAWLAVVMLSADLVRWFQLLCMDDYWCQARPKSLRWRIFHAPGRIVRGARQRIVRLIDGWPDAAAILGAYGRIAALA
jgi:hypothetical protein